MKYLKLPVAILVVLFYALALIVDRSAGVIYFFLLLLGIIGFVVQAKPDGKSLINLSKESWPLLLAMATPLIAVLVNQLVLGKFSFRSYDMQFRLALFALLFWAMSLMCLQQMRHMQWGVIVGAFLATAKIYILTDGGGERYGTDFIPIIIFSELALLTGTFAVFSIIWNHMGQKFLIGLKLAAFVSGVYAAYLAQSRGVWATIFVVAIVFCFIVKRVRLKYRFGAAMLTLFFIVISFHYSHILRDRIAAAEADIVQYANGNNIDTSLGLRFQLWRGSWLLFKQHPVVGVGIEAFPDALKELAAQKVITPYAATLPHSHNEILFMMARLGIFGLIAILAVYFIPFYYFAREWRHSDDEVRYAAGMGMSLTLGFFTLGLVDVIFLWWECYPYYAIGVAFCQIYIIKRKAYLAIPIESVAA